MRYAVATGRATRDITVSCALRLAPFLFQRPGELRNAEWVELDHDSGTWAIPASRMKRTKQGKAAGVLTIWMS